MACPPARPVAAFRLISLAAAIFSAMAYNTAQERDLLNWIAQEGGDFKVTIDRNPAGVRGLFAAQGIRKGDVLVHIPDHLVLSVPATPASEAGPVLLRELYSPCSRLWPYLKVLPNQSEVLTGYNFPTEYIPYLADDQLEQQVRDSFKLHARTALQGQQDDVMVTTIAEAVGRENISLPYYEYIVSLLTSRTFSLRKAALSLVPLLDLLNHDPRGINELDSTHAVGVRLIAGKDLDPGEEVTISYGNLRSDELLLYYGFLDAVTHPPRLLSVDHREFSAYESDELNDDPLTGPPDEVEGEVKRLEGILTRFEERLQELGPVPEDPHPHVAGLLRGLHQQRRAALRNEIARLRAMLGEDHTSEL